MVKWPKNVLKRKPVNGRNLVIELVVTKGVFTEPRINLIGCRVGVSDAGYPPFPRQETAHKVEWHGSSAEFG